MDGLSLFAFLILILSVSAQERACLEGFDVGNVTLIPVDPQNPTIVLVDAGWDSSTLNNEVLRIILEEIMGYPTGIVYNAWIDDLVSGKADIYLELWEGLDPVSVELGDGSIVAVGDLGVVGQVGWFMPKYVLDLNPDLESWRALRYPENVYLFSKQWDPSVNYGRSREEILKSASHTIEYFNSLLASGQGLTAELNSTVDALLSLARNLSSFGTTHSDFDTSFVGEFYTPNEASDWATPDGAIIDYLGINFQLVEVDMPSEENLIATLVAAYAQHKPILMYFWTPHQIFDPRSGMELVRLQFPQPKVACDVDPSTPTCVYPADNLQKLASAALAAKAPEVFELVKRFQYSSNSDQISMLASLTYENKTYKEAACQWVRERFTYVANLLPPPKPIYTLNFSDPLTQGVLAVMALLMLTSLVFLVMLVLNWNNSVVVAASRPFCIVMLLGSLVGYGSVLPFLGEQTQTSCILQIWILCVGFVLMYSNLLLKTLRVFLIFSRPGLRSARWLHNRHLAFYSLIFVVIEVSVLAAWTAADPPTIAFDRVTDSTYTIPQCKSSNTLLSTAFAWTLLALNLLMVVVAAVIAFFLRNVDSHYNESKFIGFAIYNTIIVCLVVVPIVAIHGVVSLQTQSALLLFGILLVFGFTTITIFGPKVFLISQGRGANSRLSNSDDSGQPKKRISQQQGMFLKGVAASSFKEMDLATLPS